MTLSGCGGKDVGDFTSKATGVWQRNGNLQDNRLEVLDDGTWTNQTLEELLPGGSLLYEEVQTMEYLSLIIPVLVIILVLAPVIWWISTSNGFKRKSIKIGEALSGIEIALTKRYDLLTKLLDVAKGYATHETELFTQVVGLRRGMSVGEMNEKHTQLDELNTQILAIAEQYPKLRSAEVFRELQAGIRDAEEHLQAARRLYNSNVTAFNTAVDVFPSSIIAKSQKLVKHEFFVAEAAKRHDVKISF